MHRGSAYMSILNIAGSSYFLFVLVYLFFFVYNISCLKTVVSMRNWYISSFLWICSSDMWKIKIKELRFWSDGSKLCSGIIRDVLDMCRGDVVTIW